ncbi:autotransporter outer membrane beta-barrel domain-containing protein [Stenotrophomonas cyclobalanopsidis]|uniref:autotransporter family protein n=1 Tax=Stenotrophomonas cyclobalanopsidis TaxID=2771362 RepID=UPI001FE547FE|nr:autotransporter outer membrane beta-barrel domain-containing protein [Stenotrophomonas cyclobalanopsidis]
MVFTTFFGTTPGPTGTSALVVDASHVEGATGAAFYVSQYPTRDTAVAADILLQNGSTATGGNGRILETNGNAEATFTADNSRLAGDIVNGAGAIINVTLRNGSALTGVMSNVTRASVDNATWNMTGNSTVGALSLGNGAVSLGDGSAFHTLNVSGNFTGAGGTLLFNTVLAGDDAASDKLVIGGDTSGTANVRVNNVSGAGAQTNQGIQLIQVGGASNGQFFLAGRAVGGQYEYFLNKGDGTDGNWYLRSVLPTAPDPCDTDPTLPDCNPVLPGPDPDPVLRPEGGAYLANLRASQDMFRIGYHDRHAGQNNGRAWARVDGSRQGFDAASRQLDIHGNSQALTVGADLWRAANGSGVGMMLSSGNATSTSTNPLSGYYARGKVKGEALGIYGTLRAGNTVDPYAGFYLDGSVQRAQFRNRVEGVGLETERYDSRGWQGAVETGYAFRLGGNTNSSVFLEPQLQVGYNRWDDTRHNEVNGTVVTTDDANGLFGRVGLRLSGVTRWEGRAAQVQPYLAANWLHSRADSQVRMDGELVDARIPRSRAEVSAGASVKFANGMGVWGGLSRQQDSGYQLTSAQMGLSYSW